MDESTALTPSSWQPRRRKGSKRNPYEQIDKHGFVGRKGFKKLNPKAQRLGTRGKRSWGLRMPKIRIRVVSPFNLFARLRDAYVNMMMNLASKRSVIGLTLGPLSSLKMNHPGRDRRSDSPLSVFTNAELMYIEHLKRDPDFMRSIMSS